MTRPGIVRLFPNYVEVERDYYRRTGIYPIIHTVCLQRQIVQQHPWIGDALLEAFREAAAMAPRYMNEKSRRVYEQDKVILGGEEPLAWGLRDGERRTLEAFVDYLVADGALERRVELDSLFAVA